MKAGLFNILEQTESTNNYAMQQIHAGLAKDGSSWFARFQSGGKGQRGKQWISQPDESILLSVCIQNPTHFSLQKFHFNALIALTCANFLADVCKKPIQLKWPNDLYWRDRKAGGILIENIIQGSNWKWAVVGVGINVNQGSFEDLNRAAVSVFQLAGEKHNSEELAIALQQEIIHAIQNANNLESILVSYNEMLYKRNEKVRFKTKDGEFEATVLGVNEDGELMTDASKNFRFGGVEWLI